MRALRSICVFALVALWGCELLVNPAVETLATDGGGTDAGAGGGGADGGSCPAPGAVAGAGCATVGAGGCDGAALLSCALAGSCLVWTSSSTCPGACETDDDGGAHCDCPAADAGLAIGAGCVAGSSACGGDGGQVVTCAARASDGCPVWTQTGDCSGNGLLCGPNTQLQPACKCPANTGTQLFVDPHPAGAVPVEAPTGVASPPVCRFRRIGDALAALPSGAAVAPVVALVGTPLPPRWAPQTTYAVGTEVVPTDAQKSPRAFACVQRGRSAFVEPDWSSPLARADGGREVLDGDPLDGGIVWLELGDAGIARFGREPFPLKVPPGVTVENVGCDPARFPEFGGDCSPRAYAVVGYDGGGAHMFWLAPGATLQGLTVDARAASAGSQAVVLADEPPSWSCSGSPPASLRDLVLLGSVASNDGVGAYDACAANLTNVSAGGFANNGLYVAVDEDAGTIVSASHCVFGWPDGGNHDGVYITSGIVTVTHSALSGNALSGVRIRPGAAQSATVTLSNDVIRGNGTDGVYASGLYGDGGAATSQGMVALAMSGCEVAANGAAPLDSSQGGLVVGSAMALELGTSAFHHNARAQVLIGAAPASGLTWTLDAPSCASANQLACYGDGGTGLYFDVPTGAVAPPSTLSARSWSWQNASPSDTNVPPDYRVHRSIDAVDASSACAPVVFDGGC